MSTKRTSIALAAVLLGCAVFQAVAQQTRTVTLQLLAINDFHGNLEPPEGANGLVNRVPVGGAEYLASHLHNAVRENPNSIIVAAGDIIGASPLISSLYNDGPTIEAANAMQLAVTSIGNHELDHGVPGLKRDIKGGCLKTEPCRKEEMFHGPRFQYLAANVVSEATGKPILPGTAIRTIGGVKVGFIGETTVETAKIVSASAVKGLRFLDESTTANAAAAQLERRGVHAIVLLLHEGGQQRPDSGSADPNACSNFQGPITDIAKRLSPSIKVVISGHTHQFYNCEIDGHTVTSAGAFGRLYTRLNLTVDAAKDTILSVQAKNELVTRDVPKDPVETKILEKFRPGASVLSNRAVGTVTKEIDKTENAAGESALGDVVADMFLAWASAPERGSAVVAFTNSGGIRASISPPAQPDGTLEVTYGELYTMQPFHNSVVVITMTGDMIRRLLEEQFPEGRSHPVLQVSDGFRYQYRLHAPVGQHVVEGSIQLHGRTIAPSDRIRVATSDFLIGGGDGYTVFHEGADPQVGAVDLEVSEDYFKNHSPVAPGPKNRIVRLD